MPSITIDLNVLKRLVNYCLDQDIHGRAQLVVLRRGAEGDPAAASDFAYLVKQATPEARRGTLLQYQDLLDALESGSGVPDALARFLG